MRHAHFLGLNQTGFNGLPCGSLDVLDVVPQLQTRLPLAIDTFPNASGGSNPPSPIITTPGHVTLDAAGLGPGFSLVFVGLGPTGIGTCAYRTSSAALGPHGSELLQIDPADPVWPFFAHNPGGPSLTPLVVPTDTRYAEIVVTIPFHMPEGAALAFHLLDIGDLTLSNANVVRF